MKKINILKMIKIAQGQNYSNRNWIMVLNEIWKYSPFKYKKEKTNFASIELSEKLKINVIELHLIMTFLKDQKLIECDEDQQILLTEKGFEVALQNQSAERSRRNNQATLFLSLVIAIGAIGGIIIGINNLTEKWIIASLFAVAFIVGGYIIKRSF
jgi:hypothetical protein